MSVSGVWEVDIQDDGENEKKNMTKRYVQRNSVRDLLDDLQRNSDRDLLDDYNFCEERIMCDMQDLKEERGSAKLQTEGIWCV